MWKQVLLEWNKTGLVHFCGGETVSTAAPFDWSVDCNPTQTIKFIVPCLHKQGHLIFKGLHQVAQYHAAWQRAAGFQLGGFAWREAVITGALPEVPLIVLPSDGWRVLPADLQVYPPIWRAGGRLANTLVEAQVYLTNPAEAWVACPGILHRS